MFALTVAADFVKCPACQRSMKLEKLDRHLNSCGKTSTTTGWGALGGCGRLSDCAF